MASAGAAAMTVDGLGVARVDGAFVAAPARQTAAAVGVEDGRGTDGKGLHMEGLGGGAPGGR